jgi:hypothetical protein
MTRTQRVLAVVSFKRFVSHTVTRQGLSRFICECNHDEHHRVKLTTPPQVAWVLKQERKLGPRITQKDVPERSNKCP